MKCKFKVGDIVKYNENIGKVVKITDTLISTDWRYGSDFNSEQSLDSICHDSLGFMNKISLVTPANEWKGGTKKCRSL